MTRQQTIDKAVAWALDTATSPAHGYDQNKRWGPDYDCSSFVISAWQNAGVPVKDEGATYTGNMYYPFIRCGFKDVTLRVNLKTGAGLEKGDVLLNKANHTEMYVGGNQNVKASINEKGGTTGGQTGDQNGREIRVSGYYNYPWDCVLRYMPEEEKTEPTPAPVTLPCYIKLPELQRGDKGEYVKALQFLLNGRGSSVGVYGADGDFGPATEAAVLAFQRRNSLEADGIVGNATWQKLMSS
jgi:hypothetical protein